MKKYDVNTIVAYAHGDDIEDFDIEELEDNYLFMFEVILYTNDKKIYNLCSHKVKCNYNFVKLLINKYKDDIEYICKVGDYFIDNSSEDEITPEIVEISLIIYNILKSKGDVYEDLALQYKLNARRFYSQEMMMIDYCKSLLDEEASEYIGTGFLAIESKFSDKKIILNYFAESMINEIFEKNHIKLEKLLHQRFSTYESFIKYGKYKFLCEIINEYDESLASYLSINPNILDSFKKELKSIERKWFNYNEHLLREKYSLIFQIVEEYLREGNVGMMTSYAAQELGILDQLIKYEYHGNPEQVKIFLESAEEEKVQFPFDFHALCHEIKKIIQDVLKSNDISQITKKYFNPDGSFNYNFNAPSNTPKSGKKFR